MRSVPLEELPRCEEGCGCARSFHILKALLCSCRPAKHHRLSVVVHIYLCIDSLSTMVVGCSSERCALTRDHDVHIVLIYVCPCAPNNNLSHKLDQFSPPHDCMTSFQFIRVLHAVTFHRLRFSFFFWLFLSSGAMAQQAKRQRGGDGEPVQGVSPGTEDTTSTPLMCQEAHRILQQYSLGRMRVPLEELGVSPLNRAISGTHVHALGRRIMSVEGFVMFRYQRGWCHEPNPEDLLEVARNTNRVARATSLLSEVPMVPLKGSIAKTHLMNFLQCLKAGNIYWNDSKKLMLPDAAQDLLIDHLTHGMFYEVFSWACVRDDHAGLLALAAADNLDSAFALGENELSLLKCIHSSLNVVRLPVGKTQFEMIRDFAMQSCGQRWTEADMIAIYNFAKVVGPVHLEFLLDTVAIHITWDEIAVRPSDFHYMSKVAFACPWLKIALLTAQYFPQPDCVIAGPFGKNYGNMLTQKDLERIARAPSASLARAEAFLTYLVTTYMTKNLSCEKLAIEIPGAFMRTARAVLMCRELDKGDVDLLKVEQKLRQKLDAGDLPEPFNAGADESKDAKKDGQTTKVPSILPDSLPTLEFNDMGLVENVAVLARAKNLTLGCRVTAIRAVRSIRKGGGGVLKALHTKDALVTWDEGALMDVVGDGIHDRLISLASLQVVEAPKPSPSVGKVPKKQETILPTGIKWAKITDDMGSTGAHQLVLAALIRSMPLDPLALTKC